MMSWCPMAKSKTRTFCPYCYSIVPAGKTCPCRNRDGCRKAQEPWRASYNAREYERNRQDVIEFQHGRCKDCGRQCAEWDGVKWVTRRLGGEVDHELPLAEGGTNEKSNLALRCQRCHRKADAARRNRRSQHRA